MFCADPASALPRKKSPTHVIMIGRRPMMSASLPVSGRIAAEARPYAEPTQTNSSPPLSSFVIVGSAVETAVTSSAERKLQTTTAVKESQKTEPLGRPDFGGAAAASATSASGERGVSGARGEVMTGLRAERLGGMKRACPRRAGEARRAALAGRKGRAGKGERARVEIEDGKMESGECSRFQCTGHISGHLGVKNKRRAGGCVEDKITTDRPWGMLIPSLPSTALRPTGTRVGFPSEPAARPGPPSAATYRISHSIEPDHTEFLKQSGGE